MSKSSLTNHNLNIKKRNDAPPRKRLYKNMSVHFVQTKSWRSHTNKKDSENTSKSLGSDRREKGCRLDFDCEASIHKILGIERGDRLEGVG